MDTLLSDLRFALRQLRHAPGFSIVAVLTLALGIGANAALFTVAESILRRPGPGVGEPAALVWVGATTRARSRPMGVSYHVAQRLRAEIPRFSHVTTIRDVPLSLATRGAATKVKAQAVSGDYFAMLRLRFALGRGFGPSEDAVEGRHPLAVLNYQTWQGAFGGDSSIVGESILLNGLPHTVIGVAAEGFNGAEKDEEVRAVWVPSSMLAVLHPEWRSLVSDPSSSDIRVLARLRDVDDRERVQSEVRRLGGAIAAADTTRDAGWRLDLYNASAGIPAGGEKSVAPVAALSFAVTGFVLLLCCANVSNLMLARALSRQREITTRLAIGASRWRVVRQLLTESLVLSVVSSLGALVMASWGVSLLLATALPVPLDVSLDWRVFGVSAALALTSGIAFGLAPALHATRTGVAGALRDASTGGARSRSRLQSGLVMAQVALSLLLLTMSGLFLRSLDKARRIDVGFDAGANVLALSYDVSLQRYDTARAARFTDALVARARGLNGVTSVSVTSMVPLTEWSTARVAFERNDAGGATEGIIVSLLSVYPDYLRTIGTALIAGRDIAPSDVQEAPRVAVVSEAFARRHAEGQSALGMRLSLDGAGGPWWTVVGVAREAINGELRTPVTGAVYLPFRQRPSKAVTVLVRTRGDEAASLAAPLRAEMAALDASLPVVSSRTMAEVRKRATSEQGAGATILAIFGALALLLASIGLHGVVNFMVRQRTREIGIRMALGATGRGVTALFVRRGLRLTAAGTAIGIAMSLVATRLAESFLFGISATDSLTFFAVCTLFIAVAAVACWLPARRAARTNPVLAMRAE